MENKTWEKSGKFVSPKMWEPWYVQKQMMQNQLLLLQDNEGSQASSGEPKPSLGLEFEDLSIFEKGMDTPSPNYTSKLEPKYFKCKCFTKYTIN